MSSNLSPDLILGVFSLDFLDLLSQLSSDFLLGSPLFGLLSLGLISSTLSAGFSPLTGLSLDINPADLLIGNSSGLANISSNLSPDLLLGVFSLDNLDLLSLLLGSPLFDFYLSSLGLKSSSLSLDFSPLGSFSID